MKKVFLFLSVFFFLLNTNYRDIKAEGDVNIQVIYSDLIVNQNDTIKILINLSEVKYYQSIQLIIDLDNNFEIINEEPCSLTTNSYFSSNELYVNTIEDNVIKFVGFKNNNMVNSNFNNICEINLKVLKNSDNVDSLFKTFKISLFNEEYETIPTILSKTEGLKYNWNIDYYEVLVFEEFPSFLDDITIINRKSSDYQIRLIIDNLDKTKIGSQIVSVYIYDYTNEQTLYLSKSVLVIDNDSPTIEGTTNLLINDFELKEELFHQFNISDNYDLDPDVVYSYFDKDLGSLDTFKIFFEYLKNNPIGYIKVIAVDSSNNQSLEFIQEVKINDTLAPELVYDETIEIKDTELETFDIYEHIEISDMYDKKPNVFITSGLDFKEKIISSLEETIIFYGIDNIGNKTETKQLVVKLIDTTSPVLEKTQDLEIDDVNFKSIESNIQSCFVFSDNLSKELTYSYIYLLDEREISKEEFNSNLYLGKTLYLKITGMDSFNNTSNTISVLVKLNDTISPKIMIKNIENDKKYLSINKLDYEVSDNFLNDLSISIFLNDLPYDDTPITNPGKYDLKIVVVDGNNNISEEVVSFEIIKNNLIGCGLDSECYHDNYRAVIFIACGILGITMLIIVFKVLLNKPKKTKE